MNIKDQRIFKRLATVFFFVASLMAGVYFVDSGIGHQGSDQTPGEANLASRRHVVYGHHSCHQHNANCYTDTFQEPENTSRAVDILFVVQTSESIIPEKARVIEGLNNFIAALPDGGDFHIAVMLAHGSTSPNSGTLFRVDSDPAVLKTTDLSDSQIETILATKLNSAPQDPDAGGGEEGLYSLFHAITTPSLLQTAQSQGFFRPEAALGIVFIGDRRDICATVPAGVPAESDPGKINARIRDCEGLTPQGLTNRLKNLKGDLPVVVSGIVYTSTPMDASEGEIGYGYLDVIHLNSGVAVDIAKDDIAAGLASIAQLSGGTMVPQTSFTLTHPGADSATLKVQVNGQDVPYQLQGDVVTITQNIPPGAVVTIYYCVKSTDDHHGGHDHDCKDKKKRRHHWLGWNFWNNGWHWGWIYQHGDHDKDCDDDRDDHQHHHGDHHGDHHGGKGDHDDDDDRDDHHGHKGWPGSPSKTPPRSHW